MASFPVDAAAIHGELVLTFTPESLKRQNELIRDLQKELAKKERELSDQKWILEQYLQSPSWRVTAPLRWFARLLRDLSALVSKVSGKPRGAEPAMAEEAAPAGEQISPAEARYLSDLKKVFTSFYRGSFETFLLSGATLDVPVSKNPKVSILLVLFNRAELTFACLRSIA